MHFSNVSPPSLSSVCAARLAPGQSCGMSSPADPVLGQVLKGQRLGPVQFDVAVKRLRVVEAYQLSQFRNEANTLKVGLTAIPLPPRALLSDRCTCLSIRLLAAAQLGLEKAGMMQCEDAIG